MSSSGDSGGTKATILIPESQIKKIAAAVVTSIVPLWVFSIDRIGDLRELIFQTINIWVLDNIFRPIIQAVLGIGGTIIEAVLVIAFGTDQAIGGRPGLADFALVIATTIVGAVAPAGAALIGVIDSFNQSIADIAASAGLLAPPIVAGLWVAEGAVVAYVAWTLIRTINLPFVDLDAIIERAFFPVRWLARRVT